MKNRQFTSAEQALLQEVMALRRDVRGNRFTRQPLNDDVIDQILSAGVMAPSVGYSQPWDFLVIRDQQIKSEIAENFANENAKAQPLFDERQALYTSLKLEGIKEAPINIAVFYKPSNEPVLGQTSMLKMGEYSVVCAVQNMWLMSRALNVGLGWVSILDPKSVNETLNAPDSYQLIAYLCLGYVDEFYTQPELETLKWKERKPIDSVVHYDRYDKRKS